jgi:hypothetical protein
MFCYVYRGESKEEAAAIWWEQDGKGEDDHNEEKLRECFH